MNYCSHRRVLITSNLKSLCRWNNLVFIILTYCISFIFENYIMQYDTSIHHLTHFLLIKKWRLFKYMPTFFKSVKCSFNIFPRFRLRSLKLQPFSIIRTRQRLHKTSKLQIDPVHKIILVPIMFHTHETKNLVQSRYTCRRITKTC